MVARNGIEITDSILEKMKKNHKEKRRDDDGSTKGENS